MSQLSVTMLHVRAPPNYSYGLHKSRDMKTVTGNTAFQLASLHALDPKQTAFKTPGLVALMEDPVSPGI